jgi:hypothetical protein
MLYLLLPIHESIRPGRLLTYGTVLGLPLAWGVSQVATKTLALFR